MPKFRYRALNATGQMVVGVIEAASTTAVAPELEKISVLPIEISDLGGEGRSFRQMLSRGPSSEEITGFSEDLATLIKAGVTLDRALLILADTGGRPAVGALMRELHNGISGGHSLAESVSGHPNIFPKTYVKMVEVAEVAGTLDETLRMVAHERRRGENLRRRISSAVAYPAFLIVAAIGVLIFVLTKIIPEFERALTGFQTELTGSTALVFAMSRFLRANTSLLGGLALAVILGVFLAARSRTGKSLFMTALARTPGIREIVRNEQAVSFCATLGTLSASGVDITTSLRLIRDLMRDKASQAKIDKIITGVRQGHRLSDALSEVNFLPSYAVHMLRVGEESGQLHSASMRIAGFYEGRLDRSLTRLTSILGPAIMILVAMLIAWLIISVITAMLSMNDLLT